MQWHLKPKLFIEKLPFIAVGLFSGRILNEWAAITFGENLVRSIFIPIITSFLAYFLMKKRPFATSWPFVLLLIYTVFPTPAPTIAILLLLLTLLTWGQTVPQPMRWHHLPWHLLIPSLCLILYSVTLAPTVLPADNGEFQRIATQLDVAHPPGFALYTLLAHLITQLPLGPSPAYKVSLFAALTSTATLVIVYKSVYHLTRHHSASTIATLALGTATTFWAQATTANIRSLTALFAALVLYCLIHYGTADKEERPRWLLWAALAVSLGITHHASLIFMALIFGSYLFWVEPHLITQPKQWRRPLALGLFSLLPLLYFPWRASVGARGANGLDSWGGFWNHVLATGFRGDFFYFIQPTQLWDRFGVMGNVMRFQFSPWLLLGMGVGLFYLLRQRPRFAFLLAGSWLVHTFITATYRAPQTVEYMLPAYVSATLCLGYGVGQLKWRKHKWLSQLTTAALLTTVLWQGWQQTASYRWLQQHNDTYNVSQRLLNQAPDNSTILAHWHWANPLWYLQEVEGQRSDVDIRFVFPTGEPYPATWARRVQEELDNGRFVITTHFDAAAYQKLPPPRPLDEAFLFSPTPITQLPPEYASLDIVLGDTVQLLGYHLQSTTVAIGQEATVTVAWQATADLQPNSALFAHLVGFDGLIYAQADIPITHADDGIHFTQFRLTPRFGALPGDYSLLIGGYANAVAGPTPYLDTQAQPRTAVSTLTVTAMPQRPFTQNPTFYTLTHRDQILVGYDWDHTLPQAARLYLHWQTPQGFVTEVQQPPNGRYTLPPWHGPWGITQTETELITKQPTHYVPFGQGIVWTGPLLSTDTAKKGETLALTQFFHASTPLLRDIATSVRLVGYEADGFHWAWHTLDEAFGVPAMGGIPTLKWVAGSTVYDPHRLKVAETAVSGQKIAVLLSLYDTFTNRPLPVLDERFTPATAWRTGTIVAEE